MSFYPLNGRYSLPQDTISIDLYTRVTHTFGKKNYKRIRVTTPALKMQKKNVLHINAEAQIINRQVFQMRVKYT